MGLHTLGVRLVLGLSFAGLLVLFLLVRGSQACTFAWDAVTMATDGTVITDVRYRFHFTPAGSTVEQVLFDTEQTTVTFDCQAGTYVVTAYAALAAESDPSNLVVLRQAGKSGNLIWTK
jgi:hypothetical protein